MWAQSQETHYIPTYVLYANRVWYSIMKLRRRACLMGTNWKWLCLIHCRLIITFGAFYLDQHWFRYWSLVVFSAPINYLTYCKFGTLSTTVCEIWITISLYLFKQLINKTTGHILFKPHASAFCTSNKIDKIRQIMSMNKKIKAKSLTKHSTGNIRWHVLASPVLNMSRSFGQSARLKEGKNVIRMIFHRYWYMIAVFS